VGPLYYLLPFVLIFGFWIFMLRQMQSAVTSVSFGKSRAKLLSNYEAGDIQRRSLVLTKRQRFVPRTASAAA